MSDMTTNTVSPLSSSNDSAVVQKQLERCQEDLAVALQQLFDAGQRNALLEKTLDESKQMITQQQAQVTDLQNRNTDCEEKFKELEQRMAVEPDKLGAALGQALDAIQQGLSGLKNPFIDFGLQEFDLQTQVNLQITNDGHLLLRFPGLNEQIAPQNLSQLQIQLRPIPKSQQNRSMNSD